MVVIKTVAKDQLTAMSVFAAVVEANSFTVAAQKLGTSTARVSRHVSALEASLSVKLLHRSTRKLSLTEAGAIFYESCARIVKEAELARERMTRAQSEPAGLVKVTAVPAFALRHIVPALADFHQRYPKIRVALSCSNQRMRDLAADGFDLGIRIYIGPPDPNLVTRPLARNRNILCASPTYLARAGMPRRAEDLKDHACVVFPPTAQKGKWLLQKNGRRIAAEIGEVAFESDENDAVRAAIVAGMGIGIVPLYMASEALRQGQLVSILRDYEQAFESTFYLVYLPNRTLPSRVRSLIDFLVNRFGRTPPWES
jgi:DNA-binding transcriptional LysR family regulator